MSGEGDCSQLLKHDISHQDLPCTELAIPSQGTAAGLRFLPWRGRTLLVSGLGWGFILSPSPNPQFNNVMISEGIYSLREDVDEHKP